VRLLLFSLAKLVFSIVNLISLMPVSEARILMPALLHKQCLDTDSALPPTPDWWKMTTYSDFFSARFQLRQVTISCSYPYHILSSKKAKPNAMLSSQLGEGWTEFAMGCWSLSRTFMHLLLGSVVTSEWRIEEPATAGCV
jgi:hypothetical protein